MNEAETMETENTPNRIEGSDLERKTGGGMEQARSDDVGDGVLDVPSGDDRGTNGNGRSGTPAPTSPPEAAEEDRVIKSHFDRIWQEAEAFAREVPGFDLAQELQDDAFAALLSPARGLTLEQAYFVRHGRELLSAAERAAEARVSAALAASRRVPAPLGSAAAVPGVRWDAADARTREALKARIRKGEKIYPGR